MGSRQSGKVPYHALGSIPSQSRDTNWAIGNPRHTLQNQQLCDINKSLVLWSIRWSSSIMTSTPPRARNWAGRGKRRRWSDRGIDIVLPGPVPNRSDRGFFVVLELKRHPILSSRSIAMYINNKTEFQTRAVENTHGAIHFYGKTYRPNDRNSISKRPMQK
jgi:hypothetical protein